MDNLDITPAFIDIFQRINKHLDLLPFQKVLNDQNSTLTDEHKLELKNKIKESAKKVRQLNLVLDELKDQLVREIETVQIDYEEKNRDLDALEEHLNHIRTNQFANQQKINVLRERTQELNNGINHVNTELVNLRMNSEDTDQVDGEFNLDDDQTYFKKENRFHVDQESTRKLNINYNPPKKIVKQPISSVFKAPRPQSATRDNSLKNSLIKKPLPVDRFNQLSSVNKQSNRNSKLAQSNDHHLQQPKKEKVKNVDNIYINYPQINYISLSEFNYIPKYMRGRLGFEACNRLVDEFNKSIETKYKFMMMPTSKYTNEELIKYTLYKNQEDDETRGLFFVTPKDLHDYSDLKISMNNTKIFIQCVRHCKRIKEIRGIDKLIRYVVLNW